MIMKNLYSLPNILIMMKNLLSPKFKTANSRKHISEVSREANSNKKLIPSTMKNYYSLLNVLIMMKNVFSINTIAFRIPNFTGALMVTILFITSTVNLKAQSTANYTFSTAATGSLVTDLNSNTVDMTTGTTTLIGAGLDASQSAVTTFGFDFWFMGTKFTQVSVNDDGQLRLGATPVGLNSYTINTGTLAAPKLSAFNADLRTGTTTGKVHYKLVGTGSNRCLVVEFKDMQLFYNATAAAGAATWQMRLYETTGIIEFVYGAMSAVDISTSTANRSPSIGFYTGSATNSFASVNYSSSTCSVTSAYAANAAVGATGAITNLNSASDGSRRFYKFTPVSATAPTNLTFTDIGSTSYTLNWTDNASNELGYAVYKSTDDITYTWFGTTAASAITQAVTGLTANTIYYWKVYPVREALGTPVSGYQLTGTAFTQTASGSITLPSTCVTSVVVEAWGAGGGGGNSNNAAANGGGGGGGGGYSKSTFTGLTGGNTYYFGVGTGGTGGLASSTADATVGGDSWFNNTGTNAAPASAANGILAKGGGLGVKGGVGGPP